MLQKAEPATIVIFGASGDLTRRKLVPALHSLGCEGLLPDASQVLGGSAQPPVRRGLSRSGCMKAWRTMPGSSRASATSGPRL